jgi:hypothetical protein
LTAVGVIPFVGDSLKFAKYGRFADEAVDAVHDAAGVWSKHVDDLVSTRIDTGVGQSVSAPRAAGSLDTIAEGYRLQPYYPPNRGFLGDPTRQTLVPGSVVDRYGNEQGVFVAPYGTPLGARSLPPSALNAQYNRYQVIKPIEVDRGITAPWFQQPGMGSQYVLPSSVQDLLRSGQLRRLSP